MIEAKVFDRHISRQADQQAKQRIDKKWAHGHQKSGVKIIRIFMDDITCRIAKPEITGIENGDASYFTKEHVREFVHDDAGECE
jgi:hypothetical protein